MSDASAQGPSSESESTETRRFEPEPDQHARWKAVIGARAFPEPQTPERWFEPQPQTPPQASASPIGRRFVALLLTTSVVAAIGGSVGTYAVLQGTGALQTAPSPTPAENARVFIESDSSTVIAAVRKVSPAVVQIVADDGAGNTGVGAGTIYDARGWILTNKHVVSGAATITIRLADDRRATGSIYGMDTLTDLAIVKIDGVPDLVAASLGSSSSLQVGQMAIAIGSPLGLSYPNSVTGGIVSALGRQISVAGDTTTAPTSLHGLIQTDAAINPGNSGGPLVDSSGRVIGITTAEASAGQGIGFAIPIDTAKPIMQQALAGEKLSRPFIGVAYYIIDRGLKQQYNLPLEAGAWVHKEDSGGNSVEAVVAGSAGEKAGVKTGDIITKLEGDTIDPEHPLEDLLVKYAPGRTVSLEVYREGKYLTLRVTLGTRPQTLG
jgi:serine protease Do